MAPPRIYNLHPLLAGTIGAWPQHLPRIAEMAFDWVYLNACFAPGASGSIYAIADPHELHPRVRGEATEPADELLRGFVREARAHGLKVMLDLVIPHTARESILLEQHPEWFSRDEDGRPAVPALQDPNHPNRFRRLVDLAALDLNSPEHRAAQLDHFARLIRHQRSLGIAGFRCSSAYRVPPDFWRDLIARVRADDEVDRQRLTLVGALLGCPFEAVLERLDVGFDYVFDSSKWWDFHSPWLFDQDEQLRGRMPTISFPEDHNTPRLAVDLGLEERTATERAYRLRYGWAAAYGAGVLMPMGFEFGCHRAFDPIESSPEVWQLETETPRLDLRGFVKDMNSAKRDGLFLGDAVVQRRVTAPYGRAVGLLRLDGGTPTASGACSLLLVNGDAGQPTAVPPGPVMQSAGGLFAEFVDRTPGVAARAFDPLAPFTLDPREMRVLHGRRERVAKVRAPTPRVSEKRLQELSAHRVAIEKVAPELDGGRFAVKRVVGDVLEVEADIFCDGHDKIDACIKYRTKDERDWRETPMLFVDNDRWAGRFPLTRNTRYFYTIEAWRDLFASWCGEVAKKHDAGLSLALELIEGREILEAAAAQAKGPDKAALDAVIEALRAREADHGGQLALFLEDATRLLMRRVGIRTNLSRYERELEVVADRALAACAAWYELMPRSQSGDPNRHGTFADVAANLPYVRDMGFDVLYFPPIHPIGKTNRKGRNNSLTPTPADPGSPYAIGSKEGGHDALHPELGSFDDFRRMIASAHAHGLEVAIDFAINCSPDHPWIKEHPEWFDWRPDGTIKYAENPPKKYEDIVNVHFYRGAIPSIWYALRDIILFWVEHGVTIFRVDNPHTKPLPFWEWMIREVQDRHPETMFLSEAFTRPKMMKRLAKLGFTQSYSYFTWRNTKPELAAYLAELTQDEPREHMRPNFFTNTPDINPVYLQTGGRAGHKVRFMLASTLSPVYGIYNGFELCEATPLPGKEEYLDSEKYEIRAWDYDRIGNIRDYITRVNRIRRENPALWRFTNLEFHQVWNDNILIYSKMTETLDNAILVAVNLDPHRAQGGNFEVPLWKFGLSDDSPIEVEDLLGGQRFTWHGKVQHLWLDPQHEPCAIWRLVPPGLAA